MVELDSLELVGEKIDDSLRLLLRLEYFLKFDLCHDFEEVIILTEELFLKFFI